MPIYRIKGLEAKHGDLHEVIPRLVNEVGQVAASRSLGVSPATISCWLKEHGYVLKRQYIRQGGIK